MDMIDEKRLTSLHTFLGSHLSDELTDAEGYYKYAVIARELGEPAVATMLITHSKQELKHYMDLRDAIETSIKGIEENPLYSLLDGLEHWATRISKDIEAF